MLAAHNLKPADCAPNCVLHRKFWPAETETDGFGCWAVISNTTIEQWIKMERQCTGILYGCSLGVYNKTRLKACRHACMWKCLRVTIQTMLDSPKKMDDKTAPVLQCPWFACLCNQQAPTQWGIWVANRVLDLPRRRTSFHEPRVKPVSERIIFLDDAIASTRISIL